MLHLLWSILNGIIALYFLYVIVGFIRQGKSFFKRRFKVMSIVVVCIGMVQIISAVTSEAPNNKIILANDYNTTNPSKVIKLTLEEHLTFDINMLVKYSVDQNELIPIESNSYVTGLVSGYTWEYNSIETHNFKPNDSSEFTVQGTLNWNLFGITVYSQPKTFTGTISNP
ncbi:hypothetical protein [uncultured Psychroserpens sp.]|uniref:hypothetical protein n=1 Tax=uncultured Psychroserpens sp. TaxID=255436 RepID=UPI002614345C|nr:hypothetical protein [uncultured Psychroserpens sp.]